MAGRQTFRILIVGKTGSGKSTLANAIVCRRDVLLVVDEAHPFFERGRVPKGLFEVLTGGREAGHNAIFVTQMLKGAVGGIDPGVRRQASHLVTFRLTEPEEVRALSEQFPELGERVKKLARPEDGLPPEYGVKDLDRERSGVVLRDPADPKRRRWVEWS